MEFGAAVGGDFFAPAAADLVDGLIGQYRQARACIATVAAFAKGDDCIRVIDYFLEGNATEDRGRHSMRMSAEQMFQEAGAVAALNAAYWSKAMNLTDVYDAMPHARREEWNKAIREQTTPEFEEETVRATLTGLLNARQQFFAERIDGIFRALSGEHVTNSPAAFGKRMILSGITSSYGSTGRVGYINDLRCVIAKFMGRDEPKWNATSRVVDRAKSSMRGKWVTLDGGALRLRAYLCGTAHLEVHPDMAWRLNSVLASLYPMAIPPEFRQKPKKKPRDFVMMGRPLPFAVVELLAEMKGAYRLVKQDNNWRQPYRKEDIRNALMFDHGYYWEKSPQSARDEAEKVLSYIGGVRSPHGWFQFDYDPQDVMSEIVCSGCLPDQKVHQFYPTLATVAEDAIEAAQIGADHDCLEPSAGQGGLADHMPKERTICVEISALHCRILEAKGYQTVQADFLAWADEQQRARRSFDRIVMNPPFADGRALAHVQAAALLVRPAGRLVAILPASMRGKDMTLPGGQWTLDWSRPYDNEFAGTSVAVVILTAVLNRLADGGAWLTRRCGGDADAPHEDRARPHRARSRSMRLLGAP